MEFTLKDIAKIIHATPGSISDIGNIIHISIDSRSLQNGNNTLFFAIEGPNYNGHQFIAELIEKGVRGFVVSEIPKSLQGKAQFLVVNNTLQALQTFGAHYRNLYHFPIIGITGSNGKTIVKEWLNFLLSPDFNIIRSPKSYNSQVGVPLSVLSINDKHNLGIFEAGISTVGEMEHLQKIIKPTIGILTNIGSAHDGGFANIDEKINEKLKLFAESAILIYNKSQAIDAFLKPEANTFSWSFTNKTADVLISRQETIDKTFLSLQFQGLQMQIKIPFQDDASVENAINCLMLMLHLKYEPATIESRMALLYPVEMRLKVKTGINNSTVIDDSYSSDFQSLKIALDFLESQKQHTNKTLILSDIVQSGLPEDELYSRVSHLIEAHRINRTIVIGATISRHIDKFPNCLCFDNSNQFIHAFEHINFENETILVKGARQFRFEEIVALLEEKTHETVLEINLNAISHNLNFYRAKLKPSTKIMVMVKAFGYGSGGFEIAKLLEHHHVDYLGVAFADEGISLQTAGIKLPIMVLNPENTSFSSIIQFGLEPEIYSIKGLIAFIKTATQKKIRNYPIHIKLDTGMHRLGFEESQLDMLIEMLQSTNSVKVQSILSHLATSDDIENKDFAKLQISRFEDWSLKLMHSLKIQPMRHILNTSGIDNFPEAQYDMVRLGIGLYGAFGNGEEQNLLQNAGTLKSIISQIRNIPTGDSVGYSRNFIASKPTKIATVPVGYADGISRQWGNGVGYVSIHSQKAPIVGSICMDMLMADVSLIECVEGDQVVIFGESPSIREIADKLHTIPYEILTGISQRVKRVFYRE